MIHTYHSTINRKPADVESSTYINSSKETITEYPKLKPNWIV